MVEQSVTPVQSVLFIVHGKSIGPSKGGVPEHLDVASIHVGSGDVGWPVPFTEEHVATVGVDDNGSGTLEVLQQCPPVFMVLG